MIDVVVYGATGFTGKLVAEYLQSAYGSDGELSWALAGRSLSRLESVREEIGAGRQVALIEADAANPESLSAMTAQAKAVITTVGPYQRYGEPLLQACIATGTDYVDLCGEVAWMSQMIERYGEEASRSNARIVFSCGFDSIPFDLGVYQLQMLALERFGEPIVWVKGRVRKAKGELSGGTLASGVETIEAATRDADYRARVESHFSLVPGFSGPEQPDGDTPYFDDAVNAWVGPFIMAAINTRNVHRSNALLNFRYGESFCYDEMQMTGTGSRGKRKARTMALGMKMSNVMLGVKPLRTLLTKTVLPKPGEGPSKAAREAGFYDILFVGKTSKGEVLQYAVQGDEDPGYGSTSKMIAETALCLVQDKASREQLPGGIWTPASAMGEALVTRLSQRAGLRFVPDAPL